MTETKGTRGTLVKMTDTALTVADPAADVRGRNVVDRHGDEIGSVDDLLIDDQEQKVRFLQVGAGGFLGIGEQHFLIPVDAVTKINADHVHINRERTGLRSAPPYDPELTYDYDYYGDVYGWWGYGPYWGPGYAYPRYPY